MKKSRNFLSSMISSLILGFWSLLVLVPLWIMVVNSFKDRNDIYRNPLSLPLDGINVSGYVSIFRDSSFLLYFLNSIIITFVSISLIILITSLVAYGIVRWKNRLSAVLAVIFMAGLMIPLRIGSIYILRLSKLLGLLNSIWSLLPVYASMGIPIGVLVLTELLRKIPPSLFDAAHIDGATRLRVYFTIVFPLLRAGLATVAILHLVIFWNDLWFPLILIQKESQRTLMLGISQLFGQYQTDWTRILSTLTLGTLPIVLLYMSMSRQFIAGLTAGAIKE